VEAALKRAEEQLKSAPINIDTSELERLQGAIRFAGVQLALKRRVR
jgi:F-type H+-transporting ATPase subunit epsilon